MSDYKQASVTVRVPTRIDFAGGWTDVDDFAAHEGGEVLHAAIDQYVEGSGRWQGSKLNLSYTLALPAASHLGSSGAINVAWLALTYALIGKSPDPQELAEQGYVIEGMLGIKGGKQDLYAAALGGFHRLRFAGDAKPVEVEALDVPPDSARALAERCVLCYSGDYSSSGDLHEQVWEKYRAGDQAVARSLREIRDSVQPARDALLSGDFDALAAQLTVNREAARRLHPEVVTPRMDELFTAAEGAGAVGSKGCGGGGGGCLLFICGDGKRADVENVLRAHEGVIIPFNFAPMPGVQREITDED